MVSGGDRRLRPFRQLSSGLAPVAAATVAPFRRSLIAGKEKLGD